LRKLMNSRTDDVIPATDSESHAVTCKTRVGSEKSDVGRGIVAIGVPVVV